MRIAEDLRQLNRCGRKQNGIYRISYHTTNVVVVDETNYGKTMPDTDGNDHHYSRVFAW